MATDYPKILYESRLNDATPAASTTAAGFNVANLTDYRSYTWWKPTAIPATVTVDCGSALAADYCAIWGHDLNTTGCTVEVRGSTDNFAASDVLVATSTPTSDKPLLVFFSSVSYRYWRLTFTTGTPPTIAIALVGALLDIPAGVRGGFDPVGRNTVEQYNRSVDGHALGKVIEFEAWRQTVSFELLSWAWIRSTWQAAWAAHIRSEPFLFAWDPTNHATEVFHCVVRDGFNTPHQPGSLTNLSFELNGLALEA